MNPPLKGVTTVDFAVIAAYMALMLGIGFYAMRFNRGASDYFKGGSRIHWLAAGLSSFMSGFSAWTFTGAAGLAYQHGLVAILLYVGNACTFLLGYFLFAQRWRRARIGTVMEYLVDRYDERTRQAFSWTTIFFQFFTGAAMLYGLGLFVAPTCGWPLSWAIVGSGAVILAYCVIGGLWAVVITDFLQAAILMPFTIVMAFASLAKVGGISGLVSRPAGGDDLARAAPGYGWSYVVCWAVMTSFGYNTAAMAQRYFSVEDERASRKIALLCFSLFLLGAFIWFVPPFAMRVLHPDLRSIWPGLANPQESSYALAALTLLPSGLVGIMLAAMFSATMSSISGVLNIHASIISRDIVPTFFPRKAGEAEKLTVAWAATFAVGRRDHRHRARHGRGGPQRLPGDGDLQHGDVPRLRPAGAPRPRGAAHAELVRPRRLRGGAGGGRHRQLRPRLGPRHERDHGRARLGGRLLPEPAVPGDGPGPRRAARRPLPSPRHAGGHGGGARRHLRPDHAGLPLPQPDDRARGPAVRAPRVHRAGRTSARPRSGTS